MTTHRRGALSRRLVLAGLPVGIASGATTRIALAQPSAADPVSFYLGQVLALATLQAQAVGRLQPLLLQPNPGDTLWQADASADAGVIGAVAGVVGAMEAPPELAGSVEELRLASAAYRTAADAARAASGGDLGQLPAASASLAEGASHMLLWLGALTAETGNDWGDGLRTLAASAAAPATTPPPAPVDDQRIVPAEPAATPEVVIDEPPAEEPAAEEPASQGNGQNGGNKKNRKNRKEQNQDQGEDATQ
jgi:hypothetical protein